MKGIIKDNVSYMDSFIGKEITFIEGDEVEILESIKSKNYPSGLAYVCYNPNNNASMTLVNIDKNKENRRKILWKNIKSLMA